LTKYVCSKWPLMTLNGFYGQCYFDMAIHFLMGMELCVATKTKQNQTKE
jgi:hypothetical protein